MRLALALWLLGFAGCMTYILATLGALPVRFSLQLGFVEETPALWLERGGFVGGALAGLLAVNALLVLASCLVARAPDRRRLRVPWRRYWERSARRRREARRRTRDVLSMAGAVSAAVWLLAYHMVMQKLGTQVGFAIPTPFGLYLIAVSLVVFCYGTMAYFKPPPEPR